MSDDLYYLQAKGQYCGNSLLWWQKGRHGYTTNLDEAHVFTEAEAGRQAEVRPHVDVPWRKNYVDRHASRQVNCDHVDFRTMLDDRRLDERLQMIADDDGMPEAWTSWPYGLVNQPVQIRGFIPYDCTYKDDNDPGVLC